MKRGAKTQAIRDYVAANPEQGPKDIVAGLKAQGMTVKPGLVSRQARQEEPEEIPPTDRAHGRSAHEERIGHGRAVDRGEEADRRARRCGAGSAALDVLEQLR